MKRNTMAHWMNLHWNNSFVNRMRLPLLCEKSETILLVLVGLMAVWQSDEILVYLKNFKFSTDHIVRIFTFKVTGTNAFNIEYYFWWRDDCFGLLIHHDAPFHFMVSISDEYKYKQLVFRNLPHAQLQCRLHYTPKIPIFSPVQPVSPTSIDRMGYYLGPIVEFS